LVFSVDEHEVIVAGSETAESFPQLKIKDIRKHTMDNTIEINNNAN